MHAVILSERTSIDISEFMVQRVEGLYGGSLAKETPYPFFRNLGYLCKSSTPGQGKCYVMAEYYPVPAFIGRSLEFNRELITELESSGHNFYVYLLECADGSYYTGITNDLEARIWEHQTGVHRSSYIFSRRPVQLRYFELYHEILTAIEREKQIKGWSRKKKLALVNGAWESFKR